jgi:hypothetical protein
MILLKIDFLLKKYIERGRRGDDLKKKIPVGAMAPTNPPLARLCFEHFEKE